MINDRIQKRFWTELVLLYIMLFKGHFSELEVLIQLFMSYFFDYMFMNNMKYYNVRASTIILNK